MAKFPKISRSASTLVCDASLSDCPGCQGAGSVLVREGKYQVAIRCGACGTKRVNRARFNAMSLPNICLGMTFSSYTPQDASQQTALDVCRAFSRAAREKEGAQRGVALLGPPGVGKTHLLSAVGHYLTLACGRSVTWARFDRLTASIRASFKDGGNPEMETVARLCQGDVTLLDEFGKGRGSEYEQSVADAIVTELHEREQPLVVASNYQPPGVGHGASLLERIGPRAWSRLNEACAIVPIGGIDMRTQRNRPTG